MRISEYHLGFIGFGHMAQTLCRALDRAKLIPRSQLSFVQRDPEKSRQNEREFGVTATSLSNLVKQSQILLLAVRPDQADLVLQELVGLNLDSSKMVISVLAGLKLAHYQAYLGERVQLLRAMPNIASEVGEGMTLFTYGPNPSLEFKSLTNLLFSCMGEVMEVPESSIDVGTAIAGCGPGFVFRLIEAMARAGEKQGLSYPKALKMAAQSFVGAAKLILKGKEPQALLDQIATPNGLTEAGLNMMSALHIDAHFQTVIETSAKKSKELSEDKR